MTTEEVEESGEWGDQARMVRSEEAEMTGARMTSSIFQTSTCGYVGRQQAWQTHRFGLNL